MQKELKKHLYLSAYQHINVIISIFILTVNCFAEQFNIYSSRPLGLGGAYTAIAEDTLAGYWNPAGLYNQKGFDLQLFSIGAGVNFTGNVLENANNIAKLANKFSSIEQAQKESKPIDITQISALVIAMKNIKEIGEPGKGVLMNVTGGVGVRLGKYVFSVSNYTDVGVKPYTEFNFWLGSGTIGGAGISAAGVNAFSTDLGGIVIDTTTVDSTTITPESQRLKDEITWLRHSLSSAGVAVPAVDDQTLANALVNLALANGISTSEINNAIDTIHNNRALIEALLGGDPSKAFSNNQSNLTFKGLNITEISVGRAWKFFIPDLYFGANIKLLIGTAGFYRLDVFSQKTNLEDPLKDFTKFQKQSYQPTIDFGLMYDRREIGIFGVKSKFGLVAKNINRPKFDLPDEAKKYNETEILLEPKIRAGIVIYPFNFWSISSDIDLIKSPTLIPKYDTQFWSLGTEINIINKSWLNLPLRAGIMRNTTQADNLIYTAGFGLNILHFVIDIAGSISSQTTKIESEKSSIPANAALQATLSLNF